MVRAGRTGPGPGTISASLLVLVAFGLAACDGAGTPREASRAGSALALAVPASARTIERDVPAPEVFDLSESGLWDGRPSLGGVWVAHPTARDPERVVIRNPQTGAEVIGALFRRERENPGPRFQISSEAAQALGILAGQPAVIAVTALRLQRIETAPAPPAEPQAVAEAETPAAVAPEVAPEAPAPRRGLAALRRPAAETATAVAPPSAPTPLGEPEAVVAITAVDPAPETGRGLRGLFRRSPAPAPAEPGIAATALDPVAPVAQPAAAPVVALPPPVIAPAPGTSQTAAPLTSTALLAEPGVIAPTPAAAHQPEDRRGLRALFRRPAAGTPDQATAEPALIPLPEAPAAAAPAATGPRPDRAFVQIGIFSVEGNASRARAQMQAAGLPAEIRAGRAGEREFWRVVVGPAPDAGAQADTLRRVRGLGFADAYAVAR